MCVHHKNRIKELEAEVARLTHALKNEECASQLMQHLANQSEQRAKRLAEELSLLHAQEPA